MRTRRDFSQARHLSVELTWPRCPACQGPLRYGYRTRRYILRLDGPWALKVLSKRCANKDCPVSRIYLRPMEEARMALKGYGFGLDVICEIGIRRTLHEQSASVIHNELNAKYAVSISSREVEYLLQLFNKIVRCKPLEDPTAQSMLRSQGGILLYLDGVRSNGSSEVLWVASDLLSGDPLGGALQKPDQPNPLPELLTKIKDLQAPVLAVLFDRDQPAIEEAAGRYFSDSPWGKCSLSDLVAEAESNGEAQSESPAEGGKFVLAS